MEPPGELFEGEDLATTSVLSPLGLLSPAWNKNMIPAVEHPSCTEVFGIKGSAPCSEWLNRMTEGAWSPDGTTETPHNPEFPISRLLFQGKIKTLIWRVHQKLGFLFYAADPILA